MCIKLVSIKECRACFNATQSRLWRKKRKNWRDETLKNPEIIQDYNKLMQGVVREYQILHYYLCCRKTVKCDKKFVFFLATRGCPKQFHVVKKKYTINQNQNCKGYMLSKTSYMTAFRKKSQTRERRLGWCRR